MIGLILDIILKGVDVFLLNSKYQKGIRDRLEQAIKNHNKSAVSNVKAKDDYDIILDQIEQDRKKDGRGK